MHEWTIAELQSAMGTGETSSAALVAFYLDRIARIDRAGPALNAIIEINPDAAAIAEQLDAERAARGPRGALHGIPVLLKDNIDTGDRMATTAGSLALADSSAGRDAHIVARLRAAGAVILGKTNLSEWANFRGNHTTSGWSSRGGQTRHPCALDRNPCGSSSGSAVAVAAGLCAVAVGTETDGSIVCPAHTNGIAGIKPTVGLVSRTGIIPIAHSQDTAGPMARTVADAAALLSVLAGPDSADPSTAVTALRPALDYTRYLDRDGLRGARIGVARNFFGFHSGVDRIMEEALRALRDAGAELIDPAHVANAKRIEEAEMELLLHEFHHDLDAYLKGRPGAPVHSLADVIAFNDAHADRVMPFFGQELMLQALERGPLTDAKYIEAVETCLRCARTEGIDAILAEQRLDAIVAPAGGPAWLTDWVTGDHYGGGSSSSAAVAGYPNITVPAGMIHGLPIGISFFGAAWAEPVLIRLAYAFEQATQARRPPEYRPTVEWAV